MVTNKELKDEIDGIRELIITSSKKATKRTTGIYFISIGLVMMGFWIALGSDNPIILTGSLLFIILIPFIIYFIPLRYFD